MRWYPTPSYLLKRRVIIDALRQTPARSFLEVGCGAGDLLHSLARLGYRGIGIDISPDAVEAARELHLGENVKVMRIDVAELQEKFDAVIASEVIEHIEDDVAFLSLLKERITDNGWLLLTVPAHQKKWGSNDDFCGHLRRYGRDELTEKLVLTGFSNIQVWSYGVPIYNLMKPLYDRAISARIEKSSFQGERTRKSGGMWMLTRLSGLFSLLFNDITMYPFYLFQRLFFTSNIGNGFFAIAKKI